MCNNIELSPHFELREFTESATARKHGIVNEPTDEAVENLRALCVHTLEPLREALGLPIVITSGYRCRALNERIVHHAVKSQHMNGEAADFYVAQGPVSGSRDQVSGSRDQVSGSRYQVSGNNLELETGASPMELETGASPMQLETSSRRELLIRAFRLIILDERIDYDQLILYPAFIHVSYVRNGKNRGQLTKASGNGKYQALSRAQALELL